MLLNFPSYVQARKSLIGPWRSLGPMHYARQEFACVGEGGAILSGAIERSGSIWFVSAYEATPEDYPRIIRSLLAE